jgi:NADPH:quinone reductase-like Zn-dependent oxidoreductase
MTGDNRSVMGFNLSYLFDRQDILAEGIDQLLDWYRGGKLQLPKIETYPFERVAEAHKALESGRTVGKLVLLP